MAHNGMIPLSFARPADLRQIKEPGFLLPIAPSDPALFTTEWDGEMFAIVADGPQAAVFFQITVQSRALGLFVPAPELVIDMCDAVRGPTLWDKTGSLILSEGRAHLVAERSGDRYSSGPVNVPLWNEFADNLDGGSIGFSRWGLRLTDGNQRHMLWTAPEPIMDLNLE